MKFKTSYFLLAVLFVNIVLFSSSCKKDEEADTPAATPQVWDLKMTHGNFMINSINVTTNEDASTFAHYVDYVLVSQLPDGNYSDYSIKLYIPSNTDIYLSGATTPRVTINCTNTTVNLVGDLNFGGTEYYDFYGTGAQQYAIVIFTVQDIDMTANKGNLVNIVYSFNRVYKDKTTGNELYSNPNKVEIYVKN